MSSVVESRRRAGGIWLRRRLGNRDERLPIRRYQPLATAPTRSSTERAFSLLLAISLILLHFPQFLSGSAAYGIAGFVYLYAWATAPTIRVLAGPFIWLSGFMCLSLAWAVKPIEAAPSVIGAVLAMAIGTGVGLNLSITRVRTVIREVTFWIALASQGLALLAPKVALFRGNEYSDEHAGALIGMYTSKNTLAFVLLLGFSALVFSEIDEHLTRVGAIVRLLVFGTAIALTDSATAVVLGLAVVVVRGVFWASQVRGRRITIGVTVALLAVIAPLVFAGPSFESSALLALNRDSTLTGRTDIWSAGLDAWQNSPWIGFGWGTYDSDPTIAYYQYLHYGWVRIHAHSGYLQVLIELGTLGLILLLFCWLAVARLLTRAIRSKSSLTNWWMLSIFILIVMHNLVEQSIKGLPLAMMALVYSLYAPGSRGSEFSTLAEISTAPIHRIGLRS